MTRPANPFTGPARFKQALMAGVGKGIGPGAAPSATAVGPCDPALLERAEAVLAAHVGPIAGLLNPRKRQALRVQLEQLHAQRPRPGAAPRPPRAPQRRAALLRATAPRT
ncbi:MAG: hypothetical protein JNL30_07855 [Rubrivivax sp.]|nr:hypothetical protein [Rubrivivax sp.]